MLKRSIAGLLGLYNIGLGSFALFAGRRWYDLVPGVADTGPFNPHFVADIGAAFAAAGLGLIARAWSAKLWPAALAGCIFLPVHAVIHLADLLTGSAHAPAAELGGVVFPTAFALWAALPSKDRTPYP
jgi:hypothetical protein